MMVYSLSTSLITKSENRLKNVKLNRVKNTKTNMAGLGFGRSSSSSNHPCSGAGNGEMLKQEMDQDLNFRHCSWCRREWCTQDATCSRCDEPLRPGHLPHQGASQPAADPNAAARLEQQQQQQQQESRVLKVRSADGDVFEVDLEAACMSNFIKTMVEDEDTDEVIPLCNVNSTTLGKVIDYCNHHKGNPPALVQKPLKSSNLIDCGISEWDCKYIDIEQDMIFELILAGNYLDIEGLLDLCCAKVASMIKGRTVEEIRQQFNIRSDLTPEEEALVRDDSSCPAVNPQRPEATRTGSKALLEKASKVAKDKLKDIELAVDIPEVFKTMEVPAPYRSFAGKLTKLRASFAEQCTAQAVDALSKLDPRTSMKMSYKNFQEADKHGHGVLNLEHYLHFSRKEHDQFCETIGVELPFDEGLYVEGFACQQFERRGGVTFTEVQICSHMACRVLN